MQSFEEHWQWFKQYVAAQRAKEPNDPTPLDLKFEHTQHVLENARYIVRKEGLSGTLAWASELAALYHDLGRFEQYLRYRTFKDKLSESHGLLGVKIIKKTGCLGQESPVVQKLVRVAVGLHNFFAIPPALPEEISLVLKVTRDADKLDILRIMAAHLAKKPYNPTVVLQLPDDPTIYSPEVIAKTLKDTYASYGDLRSVNDFRLLLGSWFEDLNFASSKEAMIRQGHGRKLVEDLPSDGPYAEARAYVLAKLS